MSGRCNNAYRSRRKTQCSDYSDSRITLSTSRPITCVYAKRSFYAAVNGVFGKLLNLASEEVILELVRTKCTPILLYGLECFQLG